MLPGPLPRRVNIRKAVTRQAHYHGALGVSELARFADVLEADSRVVATVDFGDDEEGRQYLDVELVADVVLQCQRCLQPMRSQVSSRSRLALVVGDEQAAQLPKTYEPWIALDEVDLWEVAAEELALALPVVAYHDDDGCRAPMAGPSSAAAEGRAGNPFNILSTLLISGDTEEKQ